MSDEEIFFDNEEEVQNEEYQEVYEEDVLDSPDKLFDSANNSLGIDDYYAIDLFYKAYIDESASDDIKKESIKNIALAISQHSDDFERIVNVLSDVFYASQDGLLNNDELTQVILGMMGNLANSGETYSNFLASVESQINKNDNTVLYAEVKLRQCEKMLLKGESEKVEAIMNDVEPLISYNPESNNSFMRSSYLKLLILKINIADEHHDEDSMIKLYDEAKKIPQYSLTSYQNAVFTKMEAILLKKNRKFYEAKTKFYEAFQLFDDLGNDKRIGTIKNMALCEMASRGIASIFNSSRFAPYKNDENVQPIMKMIDAYSKNDIVKYIDLIEPVSKLFYNNQFDIQLLYEIRKIVLRGAILKFSRNYHKYQLKFAAKEFSSTEDEVRDIAMDLIISKDLNALFNPENNVVTVLEQVKPSRYLLGTNSIISTVEITLNRIMNETQLDY